MYKYLRLGIVVAIIYFIIDYFMKLPPICSVIANLCFASILCFHYKKYQELLTKSEKNVLFFGMILLGGTGIIKLINLLF